MTASDSSPPLTNGQLQQLVAEADRGGRTPLGAAANVMLAICILWSLFQIWIASPLPFLLGILVFNDTETRAIHLAFAVLLAFMSFPAFRSSPRQRIPLTDWLLGALGAFCAAYLFLFYDALAMRPGQPTTLDLLASLTGLALLLEAARRALGLPLVLLAIVFLVYIFAGSYMPDMIAHKGASLNKGMSHLWLTTEGVFGVALGVSSGFIFLFVLFGALLETAGAGNYFIKSAVGLLGHLRGGPAKAAVVGSAATGVISGSSIANVVTTGTFTIPLMKRIGYRPDKAAAVEVAGSVNGQIMPPVMGAAAFLMVEYVGISYVEVLKHAIVPALISYIALFYIVHLEAMKADLQGIPRAHPRSWQQGLYSFTLTLCGVIILAGAVYWGLGWLKTLLPQAASFIIAALLAVTYLALLKISACYPRLRMDDPDDPIETLPDVAPTLLSGLHYLLPLIALIWSLTVEQLSPGLSAFWAAVLLAVIVLTQRPLSAWLRKQGRLAEEARHGLTDLRDGLINGARNMVTIGIATATAGIIVGAVTLTGVGLVMTELVEALSGGNILLMLFMVALICLILGMGLPTTANYIVVSTLMAPVIVEVGAQNGLLVPLIAVHLFVFYFGLMADVTPPVGLASYAAAGIALTDPIKTGITAFGYSIRTAVLPFMFIYNTQLLLIDIDGPLQLVLTLVSATAASLVFAAATQGWFMAKSRWWESAALIVITFALFRPGFFLDAVYKPYHTLHGQQAFAAINTLPDKERLRLFIEGMNIEGDEIRKGVLLPLGARAENSRARLAQAGVQAVPFGDQIQVVNVRFGSRAEKLGLEMGFTISAVELPNERPAKEWVFVPTFALLGLIAWNQRRRVAKSTRRQA